LCLRCVRAFFRSRLAVVSKTLRVATRARQF
jgi:hypothetical protein